MYKVCVMVTTYNPKEYLIEQIKSILNQKNVQIDIVIRDDASKDKTFLYKFKGNDNIEIIEGKENLGVAGNIKELLNYVYFNKKNYDYYAYSDQDDVWFEDKLDVATKQLSKMNKSNIKLYYSNLLVTDRDLNPSHELFKRGVVNNSLGQALSQVFTFACTTCFTYQMIEEVLKYDFSFLGFDSLLYYIGIIIGEIYFDNNQHGDNVSGQKEKGLKYFIHHAIKVLRNSNTVTFKFCSQYILKNFETYLNDEERRLVECVANYKGITSRLKLIFNKNIKANYMPKDFYRWCRILLGKY